MERVKAGVVAITRELNLELHLISFHWDAAHRASSPNPWPTPRASRPTTWELSVLDYLAGYLREDVLVHLADLQRTKSSRVPIEERWGQAGDNHHIASSVQVQGEDLGEARDSP